MSAWKTMDSAPVEADVLLWVDANGTFVTIGYKDRSGSWNVLASEYGDHRTLSGRALYWMPLPAPPQSSESNARIVAGPEKGE